MRRRARFAPPVRIIPPQLVSYDHELIRISQPQTKPRVNKFPVQVPMTVIFHQEQKHMNWPFQPVRMIVVGEWFSTASVGAAFTREVSHVSQHLVGGRRDCDWFD
jgi:hypothetical protein